MLASPVRVPLPTNDISGNPYDKAVQLLIPAIVKACGGDQCLSVAKADDGYPGNDDEVCDTVDSAKDTVPEEDGSTGTVTVPRNGTIVLLVNIPCEKQSKASVPTPDPGSTDEAGSSTTPAP